MGESKMPARRVMFCCESCADNYPEGCGYFDRDDLRVMPNGAWLCDGCFTDCDAYDYGFRDLDEDEEIAKPDWLDLPVPPALVPADLVEPMVEALDSCREYFYNRSDAVDGDYGQPEPNAEMALLTEIDAAILRARQAMQMEART